MNKLNEERPQEGKLVENAFMSVAVELLEIRANTLSSEAGGKKDVNGGNNEQRETFMKEVDAQLNEMGMKIADVQGHINGIKMGALQDKCHCVHVDQLDARVNTANQKPGSSRRVVMA